MKKVFIAYGTTEGQTATIANFLSDVLREHGHEVTLLDVKKAADTVLDGCDGAIVGSSVHLGKHDKHVVRFVRANHAALARIPAAFYSVSLAAHGDDAEAQGYVEKFEEETGWRPDTVALVAGALLYTQYGFLKRHLMRRVARGKPGELDTDVSRDHVYTEWDGVRSFAEHFAQDLDAAPAG